jgi:hypothetical protein
MSSTQAVDEAASVPVRRGDLQTQLGFTSLDGGSLELSAGIVSRLKISFEQRELINKEIREVARILDRLECASAEVVVHENGDQAITPSRSC